MQMPLQCLFFSIRDLNRTVALGKCPAMITHFHTDKIEDIVMLSIHMTVEWLQAFCVPQHNNIHIKHSSKLQDSIRYPT